MLEEGHLEKFYLGNPLAGASVMLEEGHLEMNTSDLGNPLCNADTLEHVLSFVGARHGLFVSRVCCIWRAAYTKTMLALGANSIGRHVHSIRCTSYEAAFASPSTVQVAQAYGLPLAGDKWKLQRCAGRADIDTLQTAHKLGLRLLPPLLHGAAECSDGLQKLKWLRKQQGCQLPADVSVSAAQAGCVQMLQWLREQGCFLSAQTLYSAAATPNSIHVLVYLSEAGVPFSKNHDLCRAAAGAGDAEQLEWLYNHGATLSDDVVWFAARGGSVDVFDWLQQQEWAHRARGAPFSVRIMREAAYYGHLRLCKWLLGAGCQWDSSVCSAAALSCQLDILRWLHESGCEWVVADVCFNAMQGQGNSLAIVQFLHEQGELSTVELLTEALRYAGAANKLPVAQWLIEQAAVWPDVLQDRHGTPWYGETLAWARAQGCDARTL
jgi:hypothetical protein